MAASMCIALNPNSGGKCKYAGQGLRALPIRILSVGKKRSPGVQLLVDDYINKLKHYCTVEDVQIRPNPKNSRDVRAQVDYEDMAVMNVIRSDDWVVMLDERGQDVRSEQMAEIVGDASNTGASRLSFCIGGPYGHGRQLRERANLSIKLSSLVMDNTETAKLPSLVMDSHVRDTVQKVLQVLLVNSLHFEAPMFELGAADLFVRIHG